MNMRPSYVRMFKGLVEATLSPQSTLVALTQEGCIVTCLTFAIRTVTVLD